MVAARCGAAPLLSIDFDQTGAVSTQAGFSSFAGPTTTTATVSNAYATSAGSVNVQISNESGFFNRAKLSDSGSFTNSALYNDFAYTNTTATGGAGTASITLTLSGAGIAANTPYSLTFYSYDSGPGTTNVAEGSHSVLIGGATGSGTTGTPATITYTSTSPITPPTSNGQYSATSTFTSNASGVLAFTLTDTYTGTTDVNGRAPQRVHGEYARAGRRGARSRHAALGPPRPPQAACLSGGTDSGRTRAS